MGQPDRVRKVHVKSTFQITDGVERFSHVFRRVELGDQLGHHILLVKPFQDLLMKGAAAQLGLRSTRVPNEQKQQFHDGHTVDMVQ